MASCLKKVVIGLLALVVTSDLVQAVPHIAHHGIQAVELDTNSTTTTTTAAVQCEGDPLEDYNLGMRVGALFIILATSAIGIFSPIIMHRVSPYSKGSFRDWLLTVGKFFGTGVILATAFIHMLPDAMSNFASPCLSAGWQSYPAFGGVFCMIASLALQLLELSAITHLDSLAHRHGEQNKENENVDPEKTANGVVEGHDHSGFDTDGHVHSAGFLENEEQSVRNIGTLILELGIVMHSVIIGITLGTASASEFITLLIALVFHQFFEGIALGTRINDLECKSWKKPLIMGSLFVCMTPMGVAIGIGVRSSLQYSASVLAQAILDSLSAGILLYNAYVSLMSIEINHNAGFRRSSMVRKIVCFCSMYVGAGLMALLGTWA